MVKINHVNYGIQGFEPGAGGSGSKCANDYVPPDPPLEGYSGSEQEQTHLDLLLFGSCILVQKFTNSAPTRLSYKLFVLTYFLAPSKTWDQI